MIGGRSVLFCPLGVERFWGGIVQTDSGDSMEARGNEMRWKLESWGGNLGCFHARFQPRQQTRDPSSLGNWRAGGCGVQDG
jgi:hypothetical protein